MIRLSIFFLSLALALTALGELGTATQVDRLLSSRLHSQNTRIGRRFYDTVGFYNLTFVHVNDVHAHLDQYRTSGTDCDPPSSQCVGGYARIKSKVDEIRASSPADTLVLSMGDEFQGTLFYSYYGGEKIAETVNALEFDAMTIGNHEFDGGDDHLAAYFDNITSTIPIVSANIQTQNKALASHIKPYHVFPEHSLAVIGLTTIHTKTTSSPSDETEFLDPVEVLQKTVDVIHAKENVDRIVAMTHIGYAEDVDLAARTRGVHLILGGHSHTLLGNFTEAEGPYPTIQKNLDGEEVFIVTAWRWGQVLGYINVAFEAGPGGHVLAYEGGPIPMDSSIPQDPKFQTKVDAWRAPFDSYSKEVVGWTEDVLDQTLCQKGECTLGNLITDAILDYRLGSGGRVDGAVMNAGGIRASIPAGNVTRGEIITSFPFSNAVIDLNFTATELWDMFEGIVSWRNSADKEVTSFVQVSRGIVFSYAPSLPIGRRLRTLSISGKPVDPHSKETYVISTIDFIASGGDGFLNPPKKPATAPLNTLDAVLMDYISAHTPYTPFIEGRVSKVFSGSALAAAGDKQAYVETCHGLRCRGLRE